jgi:hypothetical protein
VRAGKRTYFFDVKATRSNDYYITITESTLNLNNNQWEILKTKNVKKFFQKR